MNIKGALIIFWLTSSKVASPVNGEYLRGESNEENQELNKGEVLQDHPLPLRLLYDADSFVVDVGNDDGRRLQQHGGIPKRTCDFNGQTRNPGEWLMGPTQTCQCNRFGTGTWDSCVNNGSTTTPTTSTNGGGGDPLTALARRQQFNAKDFTFDLLGALPGSVTESGTISSLNVNTKPSLAGSGLSYSKY